MKRILVTDTACDTNDTLRREVPTIRVPFLFEVLNHHYVDDETLDLQAFLRDMDQSEQPAKSAARAPEVYLQAAGEADEVFFVTVSGHLSSSYQSACIAAEELRSQGRKAFVFDSATAGAGQTAYLYSLYERIKQNISFEDIVAMETDIARRNVTYLTLESYNQLMKSGRLPLFAGKALTMLSICPVAYAESGQIGIKSIARGMDKAIRKMAKLVREMAPDPKKFPLFISHVANLERAQKVRDAILELVPFHRVEIMQAAGLVSCYASRNGIVIGFTAS